MSRWFRDAVRLAKLDLPPRSGFHSLRRKFATELKGEAMVNLMALGGWKSEKTILECYQESDQEAMRGALERRKNAETKWYTQVVHSKNPKFGKGV